MLGPTPEEWALPLTDMNADAVGLDSQIEKSTCFWNSQRQDVSCVYRTQP